MEDFHCEEIAWAPDHANAPLWFAGSVNLGSWWVFQCRTGDNWSFQEPDEMWRVGSEVNIAHDGENLWVARQNNWQVVDDGIVENRLITSAPGRGFILFMLE